jgi:molybdopterin-containing oxidoreductase family membrane subunit
MPDQEYIMGLFKDEDQAVLAVEGLAQTPFKVESVFSPVPSHKLMAALKLKKSKVGYFTLVGGILGLLSGFGLAAFTAVQWNLIVSGKPIISLIPFFIVGFEFTILFAVFGNVIGLLTLARLPDWKGLKRYDPRCSGEHFGVLTTCTSGEKEALVAYFKKQGGEFRIFNENSV